MAELDEQQQQAPEAAPGAGEEADFSAAFKEATGSQAGGDEPPEKAPAEAGASEAPADEAATDATTGGAAEADPLAELTPEQLRQRLQEVETERDRLRTSERSQRGRVGALTRKLNTLTIGTPTPSPAPKTEETDGQAPTGESEGKPELDAELQRAIDEYPDVVGPLAASQKALQAQLEEVRGKIDKIDKVATTRDEVEADANELSIALISLEVLHPDYAEFNPQNESFTAWLGDQPQKVVELANSYDPREVSLALTLYKTERSAALAKSGEGGDQGKPDTSATDAKRQRQIDGNRQVPNRGAPVAAGVPNEFSAAFKARAAEQRR